MADPERALVDVAALMFLERLVADLRAGAVCVTNLQAGDDESFALAITWRLAEPPTPAAAADAALAAAAAVADGPPLGAQAPARCPSCGSGRFETTNDGRTCSNCCADF